MCCSVLLALLAAVGAHRAPVHQAQPEEGAPARPVTAPGDYDVELEHDGRQRYFLAHLPPQARSGAPLPLVVSFHGGGGEAGQHRDLTSMDRLADEQGFIVIYPGGTGKRGWGRRFLTWNAGPCCGAASEKKVDDVGFVIAALAEVAAHTAVDRSRIYATGLSNGAMMSYRLAHDAGQHLAAIAPVAGVVELEPFQPAAPLAVMHFHSLDDPRALYQGGLGPPFPMTRRRIDHAPVERVLERWTEQLGCRPEPEIDPARQGREDGRDATHTALRRRYTGCRDEVEVVLWQLTGAGHVWPGATRRMPRKWVGEPTSVIDANREMWTFFQRFSRADPPPLPAPDAAAGARWRPLGAQRQQERQELSTGMSVVSARLESEPLATLSDRDGAFARGAVVAGAAHSLYSRLQTGPGGVSHWRLLAQAGVRASQLQLGLLPEQVELYRITTGLTGSYRSPSENLYIAYAGVGLAADQNALLAPAVRPTAFGLGTHRLGAQLTLFYGLIFTRVGGGELIFPMAGFELRPTDSVTASLLLPFHARLSYLATKDFELGLDALMSGESYRLGIGDETDLFLARVRVGLGVKYKILDSLEWKACIGIIPWRIASRWQGTDQLETVQVEPGAYLGTGLTYRYWHGGVAPGSGSRDVANPVQRAMGAQ